MMTGLTNKLYTFHTVYYKASTTCWAHWNDGKGTGKTLRDPQTSTCIVKLSTVIRCTEHRHQLQTYIQEVIGLAVLSS